MILQLGPTDSRISHALIDFICQAQGAHPVWQDGRIAYYQYNKTSLTSMNGRRVFTVEVLWGMQIPLGAESVVVGRRS